MLLFGYMLFQSQQPEHTYNPDLHQAYRIYMAGFTGSHDFLLDDAVDRLLELKAPYVDFVEDSTELLTRAIRNGSENIGDSRLNALPDAIISYAYSGLEFEIPLLAPSIALVGKHPREYAGVVKPTKELLAELSPSSDAEKKRFKQLGKYASSKLVNCEYQFTSEEKRLLKKAKDISVANFMSRPDLGGVTNRDDE